MAFIYIPKQLVVHTYTNNRVPDPTDMTQHLWLAWLYVIIKWSFCGRINLKMLNFVTWELCHRKKPSSQFLTGQSQRHTFPHYHKHRYSGFNGDINYCFLQNTVLQYTYLLHGTGHYLKSWLSLNLSKNIQLSYGTQRFITVFTKSCHQTLSWAS
jgi:hypothetical protein